MVCELTLSDVIQDSLCLLACPVLATPELHYMHLLELIVEM